MQKIGTCLWFDDQAEEAAHFYTSVFRNSRIVSTQHYGEAGPRPAGMVMVVNFELDGHEFIALNGGPEFTFNEAMSLYIHTENQQETDYFWEALSAGGEEGPCGWLKDKFGVSWQIAPVILDQMLADSDQEKAQRVMSAMLKMSKIDIPTLQKAYDGVDSL